MAERGKAPVVIDQPAEKPGLLTRAIRAMAPGYALNRVKAQQALVVADARLGCIARRAEQLPIEDERVRARSMMRQAQRQAANHLMEIASESMSGGLSTRGFTVGRRHEANIPWSYESSADPNVDIMEAVHEANSIVGHLVQNDPIAGDAAEMIIDFILGEGLQPRPQSTKMLRNGRANVKLRQRINAKVNDSLKRHWENPRHFDVDGRLTYYQMVELGLRSAATRGDLLIIKVRRDRPFCERFGLTMPYQCRLLDATWLADHIRSHNGNRVIGGVEINDDGIETAIHLRTRQNADGTPGVSERVPREDIIHWFRQLWPGQRRGITWFAPVVNDLIDLQDNSQAALTRMKTETGVGLVLEVPFGMETEESEIGEADDMATGSFLTGASRSPAVEGKPEDYGLRSDGQMVDGRNRPIMSVTPGGVSRVRQGVKVNKLDPTPSGGFKTFMEAGGKRVASGLGLMYEMLFNDWSQSNHSLARVAQAKVDLRNARIRFSIQVTVCQAIYDLHIESGIVAKSWADEDAAAGRASRWDPTRYWNPGEISGYEVSWIAPAKISPDEERDARARQANLDSGETDLEEVLTRRGQDPYEVIRRRAEFKRWAQEECDYDVDQHRSSKVKGSSTGTNPANPVRPNGDPSGAANPEGDTANADQGAPGEGTEGIE